MPPRATYTRELIIQTAYEIVARRGLEGLSARALAHELRCSTAPVYSNFATMGELARLVVRQAKDLLQSYASTRRTENGFLDMGLGICLFARDHRQLFRALFLEGNDYRDIIEELHADLLAQMGREDSLSVLSVQERGMLLTKMGTFTYGLAAQISVGLIPSPSDAFIETTLRDIGRCVVSDALARASS
jgi:AcrR family transcriptional regulator